MSWHWLDQWAAKRQRQRYRQVTYRNARGLAIWLRNSLPYYGETPHVHGSGTHERMGTAADDRHATSAAVLAAWEHAASQAHGGAARRNPLLTSSQLIIAGDDLAHVVRQQGDPVSQLEIAAERAGAISFWVNDEEVGSKFLVFVVEDKQE